jgi:hypothetical protein
VTAIKGNCENTDQVKVTVNPSTGGGTTVTANAGADQSICNGESATLTASGGSSYLWNTGETSQSITVSPVETTVYSVTVSEGSSSDTDEVRVNVNNVVANAGVDRNIVEGETITLVATGGDSYIWNTGQKSNSITVSPDSSRTYSVTAYEGSCADTDEVEVTVEPYTNSDLIPAQADAGEDMTICFGESITLNGSGGETYIWSTGDTSSSINVSPSRTITYELQATRGGVTSSDTVTVIVENCNNSITDENDLAILEMNVYPNPTDGEITIFINNLESEANVVVNDPKGSLIYSEYLTGHELTFDRTIDLSPFRNGLYFVRLFSNDQSLVKKVMVK